MKNLGIPIIKNVLIIKSGILIFSQNFEGFKEEHSLGSDMQMVSSFISAIQSFSTELTGSTIKTIKFERFTFNFYRDQSDRDLFYIIVSDFDYDQKEINCKMLKIASLFYDKHSSELTNFNGDLSTFLTFEKDLIENNIKAKNCGSRNNCINCPYSDKKSQVINEFIENKKVLMSLLNQLLENFLNKTYEDLDLIAALVLDLDGFVIVQQSVKDLDEGTIETIMSIVEPTIEKIKKSTKTSFESGTINTDEFRLFYLELGTIPALLVLVADSYSNIDNFIPYFYIVAEKISLILSNRNTSLQIPKILYGSTLEFKPKEDSFSGRNIIIQIFVIGPEMSGKSALLEMYVNGNFVKEYKPTIGLSILEKELILTKRIKIIFRLFDMGALKNFINIRKFYYNIFKPKAVLIFFDYTRIETLDKINDWIDECRLYFKDKTIPFILVGNKNDLFEKRDGTKLKAEEIANQYHCMLFETSALTGEGIDELFTYIASNYQF